MQPQVPPPAQAPRFDARSLLAACLCVLALFFDVLGWVLAIAGIVLLRRAIFNWKAKLLLAFVAVAPKVLFVAVRSMNTPPGLSFPIEPRNLATSPSLWTWSILLAALGAFLIFMPRRFRQAPDAPMAPPPRRSPLIAALGFVPAAAAVVMLLGLTDGFHRIDDAGQGRWALRHAVRGNLAVFSAKDVVFIDAAERSRARAGRDYPVRVALADGRTFSVTTKSAAALDELRKFATTANLPAGKAHIVRGSGRWTNGASGFTLKDCVGTYEAADRTSPARSTYQFWLDGDRLAGKETVEGKYVRVLRNVKVSDSGDVEFQPAAFLDASGQDKRAVSLSFSWSSGNSYRGSSAGVAGRFVRNGFEVGAQSYRKR